MLRKLDNFRQTLSVGADDGGEREASILPDLEAVWSVTAMSKHSNVSKHSCVLNEKQPQGRRPSLRDVARCGWLVKGHEDFS
jgi:hypothetical protein